MVTDALSIWASAARIAARRDSTPGVLLERALDLGARDHQRRAQVVGDVVADALQLVEQALDLVEHQIDRARDLVDVVPLVGDRQARAEFAVHDADDRAVNALESLRGAAGEDRADRQDEKNGRHERDRQRSQHRLLQVVSLAQAASEQDHAAVGAPPGDEEGRLAAARIRQKLLPDDMRAVRRSGSAGIAGTSPNSLTPFESNSAT